jgi:hypothetical protein
MRGLVFCACIGLGLSISAEGQEHRYRVAATVVAVGGESKALIERATGDSILVAPGDEIDGATVIEIGERFVRLRFADEDLLLPLSAGEPESVPHLPGPSHESDPFNLHVAGRQLMFAVSELVENLERDGSRSETESDSEVEGEATTEQRRELTRLLGGLIKFPEKSVIRNINGESFASVEDGLEAVESLLANSLVLRFELDESPEPGKPFYVFPE